jgi:hypothetical protein
LRHDAGPFVDDDNDDEVEELGSRWTHVQYQSVHDASLSTSIWDAGFHSPNDDEYDGPPRSPSGATTTGKHWVVETKMGFIPSRTGHISLMSCRVDRAVVDIVPVVGFW